MALLNIRSISKDKTLTVNELIRDNGLSAIFLTETWLNENGSAALIEASPPNYSFFQSIRTAKLGGGTATIASNTLNCKKISFDDFPSFEYHAIVMKSQPPVLIVTVYRPPKARSTFLDDFSEFLAIIHPNYDNILITGDFNIHVDNKENLRAIRFTDLLESMDFTQHVNKPTHNRGHTLDLVITKGLNTKISSISDPLLSDHYCIFFTVEKIKIQKNVQRRVMKRYLTPAVEEQFKRLMNTDTNKTHNLDEKDPVTSFNTKVKMALDSIAPLKHKNIAKQTAPWRNEDIKLLKKSCRKAERKWRRTKLQTHRDTYLELRSAFNKALRSARKDHFSNLITTNQNNPKVLFSIINSLLNPDSKTANEMSSPTKCEEFAAYFRDKISDIRVEITRTKPANSGLKIPYPALNATMNQFAPVNMETLSKAVSKLSPSTCALDPIPTKFFKSVFDSVSTDILSIINSSLKSGIFPAALKVAMVKPILKKPNSDADVISNYRPISNLPFLSKLMERIVYDQLNAFLVSNDITDIFQSGFRSNHSTETALLKVINDLRINADSNKMSVLTLLDLSAAFDTIDHDILIDRLEKWVGLSGPVLNWIRTYLTDREYYVSVGEHRSKNVKLTCGVPQGSVLGPLFFLLYMLPLGAIFRKHSIDYHAFADDNQNYFTVEPNDYSAADRLVLCLADVDKWMSDNFLKLNQEKTEVLIIGNKTEREKLSAHMKTLAFDPKYKARNLGVIIDSDLCFESHIKNVIKIGFYHLRNIVKVLPFLSRADANKLVHAFIFSRLDYCNALLTGLPIKSTRPLQLLQNAAARALTRTRRRAHITPVLISLHWLPVRARIDFKVLLLVYKALHDKAPKYITDMVKRYTPSRPLRSAGTERLIVPRARTKTHGEAAFSYYAPNLWNTLPKDLRKANSADIFKRDLKTYLFSLAFQI